MAFPNVGPASEGWISTPSWKYNSSNNTYEAWVVIYWRGDALSSVDMWYWGGESAGWVQDTDITQGVADGTTTGWDGKTYNYRSVYLYNYRANTTVKLRSVQYIYFSGNPVNYVSAADTTTPEGITNSTLTFNDNGATSGSLITTSTTIVTGNTSELPLPGTCEKTNYITDGWSNSADGSKDYDFGQTVTVTANKTLYLHWVLNVYNITVNTDGPGSATPSSATVNAGSSVTLTATPNSGYEFDGWYDGDTLVSASNPYTFTPTSDTTLTAKFRVERAGYLHEPVTNVDYRFTDSNAIKSINIQTSSGNSNIVTLNRWYGSDGKTINSYTFINYTDIPPDGTGTSNWQTWADEGIIEDFGEFVIAPSNKAYGTTTYNPGPGSTDLASGPNRTGPSGGTYSAKIRAVIVEQDTYYTITVYGDCLFTNQSGWNGSTATITCSDTSIMSSYSITTGNSYPIGGGTSGYANPGNGSGSKTVTVQKGQSARTITFSCNQSIGGYATSTATISVNIDALGDNYLYYVDWDTDKAVPVTIWVNDNGTWVKSHYWFKDKDGNWVTAYYY